MSSELTIELSPGEFNAIGECPEKEPSFLNPAFPHPQLPMQLKIIGHIWNVGLLHPSLKKLQQHDGLCDPESHEIAIQDGLPPSRTIAVFIHEILEALDATFALETPHNTIQVLAEGLFQVFMDNGFFNMEFLGLEEDNDSQVIH